MILKKLIKYDNANALEATWVDESGVVIRCHAYADSQMDMLRADLGANAADYELLISEVESAYSPIQQVPQVPQSIDALQGLLALDHEGMAGLYETWSNAPERTFAQRAFINKSLTWKRNDPTLNAAATDLGLTSEQVDQLFILAETL